MRDRVIALKRQGRSFNQIAAELGISKGAARGLWQRHQHSPSLSDLSQPPGEPYAPPPAASPGRHPAGWEPGITVEGESGVVRTCLSEGETPDWSNVLREMKLDPEEFEVLEPVNVRTWDAAIGNGEVQRFFYYKANIIRRRSTEARRDLAELVEEIKAASTFPAIRFEERPADADPSAFLVCLSDWQLGKRDGDGTEGIVKRVLGSIDLVEQRVEELRRIDRDLPYLYVVGMGDLVEGCDGHYAMQTFEAQLHRRNQCKVARRLLLAAIRRWAPLFERVVVSGVPGNHGENRKDGKAFTSWGDNDDVAILEQAAEVLEENSQSYGHVSFVLPDEHLDVTLDLCGTTTTFIHGHQAKSGTDISSKLENWWKGQQHGLHPAGDARLLVSAHYHHFAAKQSGPRMWLQCPTLEAESTWIRTSSGAGGAPGTLSLVVGPHGWSDIQVLS